MKKLRYAFEAIFLHILFIIFKALGPCKASDIGGWIGYTIGPKLSANRKAKRHILMAMPDIGEERATEIAQGMWENLGRVIAEYPHLKKISKEHTIFENTDTLEILKKTTNSPFVLISAHLGNWEIGTPAILTQYGHKVDITYRPPNNPWVSNLIDKTRTLNNQLKTYPKSRESGRKIIQALKDGHALGILIDQKYNEGINVPFFGLPAMTNPIFVQLCQRYHCPLIPIKGVRNPHSCSFRITLYPPLTLFKEDNTPRPVEDVIKDAHALLEEWIKETPEQWLWLHHRWKNT